MQAHRVWYRTRKRAAVDLCNRRYDPRSPHGADARTENRKRGRPAQSGGTSRYPSVGLRDPFSRIGLEAPHRRLTGTRSMNIRLLSEQNIRSVAPTLPEIVALVEEAYRLDAEGKVEVPTKIGVHPERANAFLHAMPAWVGGACALGMKWVSYFPGNFDRGLPDSTGIIILNDPDHGLPCCIMEGMYVTFLRTAGCAAVAAKYLAPRPPKTLGLIGCGGLGLWALGLLSKTFSLLRQLDVSARILRSVRECCASQTDQGD